MIRGFIALLVLVLVLALVACGGARSPTPATGGGQLAGDRIRAGGDWHGESLVRAVHHTA